MKKREIIQKITGTGVVAVIRADGEQQALRIAEACAKGGIAALEITYTVPGATRIIESLVKEYRGTDFIIGAGTVLDPETACAAVLAGAQYVVSPHLCPDVVRYCNRHAVPVMPGVMTTRDAVEALELGVDILKLFPGEAFGPKIIKAFKGPLPYAEFMPTGGVDLSNVAQWIEAGASAIGVGGKLTAPAASGDFAAVEANARAFVESVAAARCKK
jgi:2-dehydro-3-deoxyphosphogluconate aldolase/(4S)-4-hydroxy-2-oxoglutarate aldolase